MRLQWVPRHLFLPKKNRADELARRRALHLPSVILCNLPPLTSRIHSCLFCDRRHTKSSSKFFGTQASSVFLEELVLPRHAGCVHPRLRCNGYSLLLNSYLSRIGRIDNPSCSACGHPSQDTSHLILHCPAMNSWSSSLIDDCLSTTTGTSPGELPGF